METNEENVTRNSEACERTQNELANRFDERETQGRGDAGGGKNETRNELKTQGKQENGTRNGR